MKIKLLIIIGLFIFSMLIVAACSSSSPTDVTNPACEPILKLKNEV